MISQLSFLSENLLIDRFMPEAFSLFRHFDALICQHDYKKTIICSFYLNKDT